MKLLSDYVDEYGLVCEIHPEHMFEGGDAANRVGLIAVANHFGHGLHTAGMEVSEETGNAMVNSMFSKIEVQRGLGVRHPDLFKWWSNPKYFSRDQQSAVVIGAGFSKNFPLVSSLFLNHLKRFGLYQNFQINGIDVDGKKKFIQGDIATPEHFNLYVRALNLWPLYPLLLLGDLFTVLNSLIIIYKSYRDADDTSNDLNHIAVCLQAKKSLPTPISYLARKLYRWFRKNAGPSNQERLPGFGPQTALDHYFGDTAIKRILGVSSPPVNELFKSFLEKEL